LRAGGDESGLLAGFGDAGQRALAGVGAGSGESCSPESALLAAAGMPMPGHAGAGGVADLTTSMPGSQPSIPKLLQGCQDVPRVISTDQLKSYGAAKREPLPGVERRQHRYRNNRAEHSHEPTRQRARQMAGFKSPGQAQRSLAAHGPIARHCRPRCHRFPVPQVSPRGGPTIPELA
jgi:hypothetical protein